MRNFLNGTSYNWIIDEHDKLRYLKTDTRRKFIKQLVAFIRQEYGPKPDKQDIIIACQAAVELFYSLKVEKSTIGGIVSVILFVHSIIATQPNYDFVILQDLLYDPAKKTGFVYNAMIYQNKRNRKADTSTTLNETESIILTDAEKKDVENFFKRCVLPRQQKEVEAKLFETKKYRREMIINDLAEYKNIWEFYFAVPEFVRKSQKVLSILCSWFWLVFDCRFYSTSSCFLILQGPLVSWTCGRWFVMKVSKHSMFASIKMVFRSRRGIPTFWTFSHWWNWFQLQNWTRQRRLFSFMMRYLSV